jgi:uncharacterized protein (TIGR00297 family)
MTLRPLLGSGLALTIAAVAWRAGSLSTSGAFAAAVLGGITVAAGWAWGALLVAFFVPSVLLSAVRSEIKARRTVGVVAKGGRRDAIQVLANGGIFALAALAALVSGWLGWRAAGAGALAAAAADTWGTEVGTLARAVPRLITSGRTVPAGTSGGVTPLGMVATLAGAAWIAAVTSLVGWTGLGVAVASGGIAGALIDSILGALWQSRRRCPVCSTGTERAVHESTRCAARWAPWWRCSYGGLERSENVDRRNFTREE